MFDVMRRAMELQRKKICKCQDGVIDGKCENCGKEHECKDEDIISSGVAEHTYMECTKCGVRCP